MNKLQKKMVVVVAFMCVGFCFVSSNYAMYRIQFSNDRNQDKKKQETQGSETKQIDQKTLDLNLYRAVKSGKASEVEDWLIQGADPCFADLKKVSVLRHAFNDGYGEIARMLIVGGANVDEQDIETGDSLIMIVLKKKQQIALKLLILFSAKLTLKNKAGKSINDLENYDEFKALVNDTLVKSGEIKKAVNQLLEQSFPLFPQDVIRSIVYDYLLDEVSKYLSAKLFEAPCIIL